MHFLQPSSSRALPRSFSDSMLTTPGPSTCPSYRRSSWLSITPLLPQRSLKYDRKLKTYVRSRASFVCSRQNLPHPRATFHITESERRRGAGAQLSYVLHVPPKQPHVQDQRDTVRGTQHARFRPGRGDDHCVHGRALQLEHLDREDASPRAALPRAQKVHGRRRATTK